LIKKLARKERSNIPNLTGLIRIMRMRFLVLCFLSFIVSTSHAELVINEVSQGVSGNGNGTQEYVELVVTGTPTCTKACADIRGWIIDDNNGFHGAGSGTGIAQGCIRFTNAAQWACVPYGSIILIYNDADKNTKISLANDATDANSDKVYIIPVSSTLLEKNLNSPNTGSSTYSGLTYSAGGDWNTVAMANGGDCFQVVAPGTLTSSYHAVAWGNNSANQQIYFSGGASGTVFYNNGNNPQLQSNWVSAATPGGETPGQANSTANGIWIQQLRNQSASGNAVNTNRAVCILNGQSFFAGGANQTTSGIYRDTLAASGGCDSIVTTLLQVVTPNNNNVPLNACDSVVLNGITYKTNIIVRDTTKSVLGCDSIYNIRDIKINNTKRDTIPACINPGQSYNAGGANQTTSGYYTDKYTAANGCDSFRTVNLKLITPVSNNQNVQGCNSVTYNGNTYTANTVLRDTTKSSLGCDSIFNIINITISSSIRDTNNVCINNGQTYFAGGANQTATGAYRDTFNIGSCDSIVVTNLTVITPVTNSSSVQACGSYTYKGITYTSNTTVRDTTTSVLGCDSVYSDLDIQFSTTLTSSFSACINPGSSYNFNGTVLITSGTYKDTLQSVNLCDSIVTLTLSEIVPASQTLPPVNGCDSVTINGNTYYNSVQTQDTLLSANGCDSVYRSFSVNIDHAPVISISSDTTTCPGQNVNITATGGGVYMWSNTDQSNTINVAPNSTTTYTVTVTNNSGCTSVASATVTVRGLLLTLGTDTSLPIKQGQTVTITASGSAPIDSIYWAPDSTNNTSVDFTVAPSVTTTYTATAADSFGCSATASIIITVLPPEGKVLMPTAFSPNGDNVNDILRPILINGVILKEFRVYNRWGELVCNDINGWDGYYKNSAQPISVYVYYLTAQDPKVANRPIYLSGNVTLIR
jgi:gliding motility-associated-like protein